MVLLQEGEGAVGCISSAWGACLVPAPTCESGLRIVPQLDPCLGALVTLHACAWW